jgi:hypothetical protein
VASPNVESELAADTHRDRTGCRSERYKGSTASPANIPTKTTPPTASCKSFPTPKWALGSDVSYGCSNLCGTAESGIGCVGVVEAPNGSRPGGQDDAESGYNDIVGEAGD